MPGKNGITWYKWCPSDFAGSPKVRSMDFYEQGLYRLLLDLNHELGSIPDDSQEIFNYLPRGVTQEQLQAWWPKVRAMFDVAVEDGRLSNSRVEKDKQEVLNKSRINSDNAKQRYQREEAPVAGQPVLKDYTKKARAPEVDVAAYAAALSSDLFEAPALLSPDLREKLLTHVSTYPDVSTWTLVGEYLAVDGHWKLKSNLCLPVLLHENVFDNIVGEAMTWDKRGRTDKLVIKTGMAPPMAAALTTKEEVL
jgi:hypothetical protein